MICSYKKMLKERRNTKVFWVVVFVATYLEFQSVHANYSQTVRPGCERIYKAFYLKMQRRGGNTLSKLQYGYFKNCGMDRSTEKPTISDCEVNGKLHDFGLRFCDMAINHPREIWRKSSLRHRLTLRGRRETERNSIVSSRERRAVPGNPCTGALAVPLYFYYGEKVSTAEVVEIVQDPVNGNFQQFLTYPCSAPAYGPLQCVPQNVEYIALVYIADGIDTEDALIRVATTCGIFVA